MRSDCDFDQKWLTEHLHACIITLFKHKWWRSHEHYFQLKYFWLSLSCMQTNIRAATSLSPHANYSVAIRPLFSAFPKKVRSDRAIRSVHYHYGHGRRGLSTYCSTGQAQKILTGAGATHKGSCSGGQPYIWPAANGRLNGNGSGDVNRGNGIDLMRTLACIDKS